MFRGIGNSLRVVRLRSLLLILLLLSLPANALAAGTILLNKPVSTWEGHKLVIIVIIAFCLTESALILVLILQRRRKTVAEESLRQKTEELDQFFSVSLDLLCVANVKGYFVRLNPSFERILGYTTEELIATPLLEFVHIDDAEATREAMATLGTQKIVYDFTNRYRCRDGTYRWFEWRAVPSGNLIYAAARDVTERKRAEEGRDERLRFERLLSDLSARFVNAPPDRVDVEIEHGLRQVLEFFKVERCGLLETLHDKASWQVTHAAVVEGVPPVPLRTDLPVSIYPWTYDKLTRKGEVVAFSRLDEVPTGATTDRQTWIEWGIRSVLYIPIITRDPVAHAIAIDSIKSERVWPEEFIPRLRLLGEIFVNALERKQIRLEIEERLRFETLISELSAGFVNLPSDEVDAKINKGLRTITEFFDSDRCTIGLFSEDGTRLVPAFEYHSALAQPAAESVSKEQVPWYFEQLMRRDTVVVNRVEDLPPEADKERQVCLAWGMKSILSVPMKKGGATFASCALVSTRAERVWPEELVQRFRFASEVFANALQHRRAETMLRTSEEKFRQFFSHTPEYCYIISPGGTILDVNDYALKALGYEKEELVGKPVATIYAPESLPKMRELSNRCREYDEIANEEMTVITRDGERRTVLINMGAVRDEDGAIIQTASVQTDITEQKRAEDEAQEARRELFQLERVARMGELTASLAHELNQPLAAILTSAQAAVRFLQSDTPDLNVFRTILQNIVQDGKRAAGVITSLRSMMKREERVREPLNMNTVLDDVLNLFHSEAIIRNVTIERDFDLSLPPILGDKNQLQQVVLNLVMNAAEAMSGSLREREKRRIILRTQATDHGIQVAVRDSGPGIDPAKLADVWQPFFTTKSTGLGMGLSVSRSIIQAHRGRISAENLPDGGAMVSFDIPVISKQ